jgi:hypothetical protein
VKSGKTSPGACPPVESFEELLRLDARDPRRAHLDDCPRCRARLIAFRSFVERRPMPAGADLGDARRRLSAAIRAEIEQESPRHRLWPRRPRPWRMQLLWKPALGLVAAGVLVILLLRPAGQGSGDGALVLRGEGPAPAALAADRAPDGSLRLSWPAVPPAEGYRVMLYGRDLAEIARLEAGRDTVLVLSAERVARLGPSGGAVFWRVAALEGGEPVSLSAPATLQLP